MESGGLFPLNDTSSLCVFCGLAVTFSQKCQVLMGLTTWPSTTGLKARVGAPSSHGTSKTTRLRAQLQSYDESQYSKGMAGLSHWYSRASRMEEFVKSHGD